MTVGLIILWLRMHVTASVLLLRVINVDSRLDTTRLISFKVKHPTRVNRASEARVSIPVNFPRLNTNWTLENHDYGLNGKL